MIDETLAQQFLDYCEDQQNLSPNSIIAYRQDLKSFVAFYRQTFGRIETQPETVLRYLRYLRNEKSLKTSTVQRRISTLRRCLQWRRQFKCGPPSPFDGLRLTFRKPIRKPRAIDACTLRCLFMDVGFEKPTSNPFFQEQITYLILRLLIVTGLNINDVFSQDSKIRVLGKGSKERIVYVANDSLIAEFRQFMEWRREKEKPSSHLFPNRCGKRLTPPAFRKRLKVLSASKNILPHLTPHQFRHSAATLLIENGVDIRIVQRLLGHASIATTEIYTHVANVALQSAISCADTLSNLVHRPPCNSAFQRLNMNSWISAGGVALPDTSLHQQAHWIAVAKADNIDKCHMTSYV